MLKVEPQYKDLPQMETITNPRIGPWVNDPSQIPEIGAPINWGQPKHPGQEQPPKRAQQDGLSDYLLPIQNGPDEESGHMGPSNDAKKPKLGLGFQQIEGPELTNTTAAQFEEMGSSLAILSEEVPRSSSVLRTVPKKRTVGAMKGSPLPTQ